MKEFPWCLHCRIDMRVEQLSEKGGVINSKIMRTHGLYSKLEDPTSGDSSNSGSAIYYQAGV